MNSQPIFFYCCTIHLLDSYNKVKAKASKVLFIILLSTVFLYSENLGFILTYSVTVYFLNGLKVNIFLIHSRSRNIPCMVFVGELYLWSYV